MFQGAIDLFTPLEEEDRLRRAYVSDLEVFSYPGLGHGLSPDKDGKPTLGPVDERVLKDLKGVSLTL